MSLFSLDSYALDLNNQAEKTLDRRGHETTESKWWEQLSLAQKFSASSLSKFGYKLIFIRQELGRRLAVLSCNGKLVVISEDGSINTSPDIILRK